MAWKYARMQFLRWFEITNMVVAILFDEFRCFRTIRGILWRFISFLKSLHVFACYIGISWHENYADVIIKIVRENPSDSWYCASYIYVCIYICAVLFKYSWVNYVDSCLFLISVYVIYLLYCDCWTSSIMNQSSELFCPLELLFMFCYGILVDKLYSS